MTSFASAIHVVAQTTWHPSAKSRRPSSGSSRSSNGFPGHDTAGDHEQIHGAQSRAPAPIDP